MVSVVFAAWVAAGEIPPGVDGLAVYGPLGALCVTLAGMVYQALRRETARADRLEAELLRLNGVVQDKFVPALLAAADAATGMQDKFVPALLTAADAVTRMTEMVRDSQVARGRNGDDK